MGRFSKTIPAVRQFQTEAVPVPFDRDKAFQLLRDGISLINSFYPAGAMEWLREHRPDVVKQLKVDFKNIEQCILDEERTKVAICVELCINHHRRAFEIFEARPPVIDVQSDLLAA